MSVYTPESSPDARSLSVRWPYVTPLVAAPRDRGTRPKLATRRTVCTRDAALELWLGRAEPGRAFGAAIMGAIAAEPARAKGRHAEGRAMYAD